MPTLGDVIGGFLSDVAQARVRADLEAVKIAQIYSADPILRHLSVPRVRLPEVIIDIPVVVVDISQPTERAGWSIEAASAAAITKAVRSALTKSGLRLPREDSARVVTAAVERAKEIFERVDRALLSPARAAAELTDAVVAAVQATSRGSAALSDLRGLPEALTSSLTALFVGESKLSPSVHVLVGAGEIKEHSDGGSNVVRLRLTVTEDAYDIIERDDGRGFLLTPE